MAMTAYALAQITIHDRPTYDRYAVQFLDVLAGFDGRLLAADEGPEVVEGDWPHQKVVLIEFPDRGALDRWAGSDAYQAIAVDRLASTTGSVLVIEGLG